MSGFTPGPWLLAERELDATTIRDGQGQLVAETWMTRHGQHVANARLIAAAPDLLEALTEYVAPFARETDERLRERAHLSPAIARLLKARTAIARATDDMAVRDEPLTKIERDEITILLQDVQDGLISIEADLWSYQRPYARLALRHGYADEGTASHPFYRVTPKGERFLQEFETVSEKLTEENAAVLRPLGVLFTPLEKAEMFILSAAQVNMVFDAVRREALSRRPDAPSAGEVDRAAEAAFRADCELSGLEPNMGRSTPAQPRGFKTEIGHWRGVASAVLATLPAPPQADGGEG